MPLTQSPKHYHPAQWEKEELPATTNSSHLKTLNVVWNTQQLATVTADAVVVAIVVIVECCHWLLLNASDVKNCVAQI